MKNKLSLNLLGRILTVFVIILISLISFVGIYITNLNKLTNVIPDYKLGMDLDGWRNIVIKVNDGTETKKYDADGNLITDDDTENTDESADNTETNTTSETEDSDENVTTVEEPINAPEVLTLDNYKAVEKILIDRLNYLKIENYTLRMDEDTGRIYIDVPENTNTDYIAQYAITKGEFKVQDADTKEVLLTNADLKEALVQYGTTTAGTTVYLSIQLNDEGTEKLKNISSTYVESTDSDGNKTTKKIEMTLDDETIISTYFQEQVNDGLIQLSVGTSTESSDLQTYLQQASNIAIFLNTDPMPITYEMEINRFVYSDITLEVLRVIIIVLCVIEVVLLIFMVIRFKGNGLLGLFVNIGFIALLLLAIRYAGVEVTLSGIAGIVIAVIFEYITTMSALKIFNTSSKDDIKRKISDFSKQFIISIIPLLVLAVTFALVKWQDMDSMGMILFWAILIMLIYNSIILLIKLFKPLENKKQNKKSKKTTKRVKKDKKANKEREAK